MSARSMLPQVTISTLERLSSWKNSLSEVVDRLAERLEIEPAVEHPEDLVEDLADRREKFK